MTKDRDFKRIVRARMAETGETYTASRAALDAHGPPTAPTAPIAPPASPATYAAARHDQARLVAPFLVEGRLSKVPSRRKARAAVLLEVLTLFRPGAVYSEVEVNDILRGIHDDVAYLRRELVNYRYLARADGRYRVVDRAPTRPLSHEQEIPAWERLWLPEFLAGRESGSVAVWAGARPGSGLDRRS